MSVQVVILAAGQGKRMKSALPKVLHTLAGDSLIGHVIKTAQTVSTKSPIIIYGHQGDVLKNALAQIDLQWAHQDKQLGTAHAVQQALPFVNPQDRILVLCGDVPLISSTTLKQLIADTPENDIGMVTVHITNPHGYGRIIRNAQHQVVGIVEEKDATDQERQINEINSGIYLIPAKVLTEALPTFKNHNAQGEYYLTDIIAYAVNQHMTIHTVEPKMTDEVQGVNDRIQLAQLERAKQKQLAEQLMRDGATLRDPARVDIRGNVTIGHDVMVDVNVIFEGNNKIGSHCVIGANVILRNVTLDDGVHIKENSVVEEARIGKDSVIGPFARIRPGTVLGEAVHIGNFVEVKNTHIGNQSKANHLSYLGDADIGARVNVGAGTITCNYDGANKHKTIIQDDVHIGSDTQLVAPVTIGKGATIAAGSTVTKDAESDALTLTHELKQRTHKDWKRPQKDS
jgi:bifunctional UDP-N-acetylglucosamine pyrophosphorylase/glucosamine-1-phosphate N-acetyltransferase